MNFLGIQIILIAFALFMLYITFIYKRKGVMSNIGFAGWSFLWFLLLFITIFPNSLNPVTKVVKVIRVMDLIMILTFMFLTLITFRNYISLNETKKKLEEIVRSLTLEKSAKKRK